MMYKIFILLFIINIGNMYADFDEDMAMQEGDKIYGPYDRNKENNLSKKYKVQDFYGTWVAVKVRLGVCDGYPEDNSSLSNLFINNKLLGKKIIIAPSIYKTDIDEVPQFSKYKIVDNLYQYDVFYATKNMKLFWNSLFQKNEQNTYEALLVLNKDVIYAMDGEAEFLIVKDKNTLIYGYAHQEVPRPMDLVYLIMLVREKEATKLDKYTIYLPNNIVSSDITYDKKEEITQKFFCGKVYDQWAEQLIKEGKYNIIRDKTLAKTPIDIE